MTSIEELYRWRQFYREAERRAKFNGASHLLQRIHRELARVERAISRATRRTR